MKEHNLAELLMHAWSIMIKFEKQLQTILQHSASSQLEIILKNRNKK